MKIDIKQLPKSEIQVIVELSQEELEKYENAASTHISESIEVPGFRKGQAPKAFVIAQVGADSFFQEVLQVALPRSYFEAVKEKNLQVISRPDIKLTSKSPLKYEARVGIMPEIEFKGYDKIKIPAGPVTVTDKEIEEVVDEMRKFRATYTPVTRPIKKGDRVEIDFQGFDEGGAALDKTKSKGHPLFVGEGSLVRGFEDELIGMKVGEKKKFPVKFPSDHGHEPFRNKTVHFEAELKKAEEPKLPELNEVLVEQLMGEKKTVSEMKEAIKADMHRRKEMESRRKRENELLEKFLKDAKLDVPPVLVEEEADYMVADLKNEIESKGLKFETYMEKMKKENRDLRKEYLPEAEKRVRVRLILNFLFKELNITVTEEEISKTSTVLLARTPTAQQAELKKQLDQKGEIYIRMKNNLMLEKLFAKFLD